MTVMRSNINIFKIQNGGRPPCWKYIRNAITRLPMDRLGRNLGGHTVNVSAVPEDWKVAIIVPVFKKGTATNVENYRPISNLSSLCCQQDYRTHH